MEWKFHNRESLGHYKRVNSENLREFVCRVQSNDHHELLALHWVLRADVTSESRTGVLIENAAVRVTRE